MTDGVDFLRDEIRCGFYIPTAIKQAWAELLSVLKVIDEICARHNIKYFADWGTMLGAVRHGGFIPWDDDLDICMLRDDYDKFRDVADEELPEGFVIHDYERQKEHWLFLARVVNHDKMCFDDDYLKAHNNFPWLVGIDIFLKDYLYKDDEKETARDKEIMHLVALVDMINEGNYNSDIVRAELEKIERATGTGSLTRFLERATGGDFLTHSPEADRAVCIELYRYAEQLMSAVKPDETDMVGQIFPWIIKNGMSAAEAKSLYDDIVRLPFENTSIPVPAAYNVMLSSRYGDYTHIYKVWSGHDYPFFEGQKQEMEEIAGESLDRFVCDESVFDSMYNRPAVDYSASLKTTCRECIDELYRLHKQAEGGVDCFNDMQQLAVDLGTLIETVKGEDSVCAVNAVAALQEFCDALWQEYSAMESSPSDGGVSLAGDKAGQDLHLSEQALDRVRDRIETDIISRREVLFLPIGCKEFKHIYRIYKEELNKPDTNVTVVPLPLLKKDYYGNVDMTEDEIQDALHLEEYKKCYNDLTIIPWYGYDITIHCPDKVYTQNVYDETNPCLTVPASYYTKAIREYARDIIYIPIGDTAEFGEEDIVDIYNLKHYVTTPAVVYADEVIVQSDNIKVRYVDALSDFAGEDTRDYWKNKIKVGDEAMQDNISNESGTGKKKLLYCVGINELYEKKDILINSLNERIDILKNGNVDVTFTLYPEDKSQWQHIDDELSGKVFDIMEKSFTELESGFKSVSETADKYDAYYGSPSPYVVEFTSQGKPAMLCDYSIDV